MQYPRIALRRKDPPINDTPGTPLEFVLRKEIETRHALIHPTPLVIDDREEALREESHMQLENADVKRLMQAVIDVIRQINELLGGLFGDAGIWLHSPGKDGKFSDETFA